MNENNVVTQGEGDQNGDGIPNEEDEEVPLQQEQKGDNRAK